MNPLYHFLKPIAEAQSPANQHWHILKNATTINRISNNNNNNHELQDLLPFCYIDIPIFHTIKPRMNTKAN
jgi:hypothetical protein